MQYPELQASPEFKGIKTGRPSVDSYTRPGFKPALNSKGLRRSVDEAVGAGCGFKPALNSKGLRP